MKQLAVLISLAILMAGCAKFPGSGTVGNTKRLVFKLRVDGQLRTGQGTGQSGLPYVYVIALNLSKSDIPTTTGPIPVVIPGGNGIVAGEVTHFILWNPLAQPQYQIFQFSDSTLNTYFQTGVPVVYTPTNEGDRELQFEVDLSQLVAAGTIDDYKSVQINFLTMNNTNTSGGGRVWDALGDGNIPTQVNSPLTVRLNSSQVYNNQNQILTEPQGDAADPDLDIVDWSVEVRIQ
ncbi:MAG: hypothetical protein JNM28_09050 [Armatimonadetes bacterium]|nr:hypothetical protein [Armatimonadota bacterium]MBS1710791.1 hypothetical protein [Armatimonadota bacterium]MBX3108463.1 hypothetical protein [Fimbriimonadaceae bacterium]